MGVGVGDHVIVVMPAYNAERTLQRTYDALPREHVDGIILVDDASQDGTVAIARELDLQLIVHERNRGYGANQKTCYSAALEAGATIVVMVHPDYQYDPALLPQMTLPIRQRSADVVFGSRLMGVSAIQQGMPWWKYLGNRFLTALENAVFGLHLSEFHTGYRAYSSAVLQDLNYNTYSDGFVFDQEIVAEIVKKGCRIAEVSVPVRYFPEASSVGLFGSILYGLRIVQLLARYLLKS